MGEGEDGLGPEGERAGEEQVGEDRVQEEVRARKEALCQQRAEGVERGRAEGEEGARHQGVRASGRKDRSRTEAVRQGEVPGLSVAENARVGVASNCVQQPLTWVTRGARR